MIAARDAVTTEGRLPGGQDGRTRAQFSLADRR